MEKRVFITGIGIITGIGNNADETLSSVFASHSGIGEIIHVSTIHKGSIPVSEVKCNNAELFHLLGIPEKEGISRTFLLGLMAAKEALKTSGINNISAWKTGLVSATTVGGMDKSELYYQDFLKNDFHNEYIDTHDCADSTEKIADYLGVSDFLTTISTACSSSANSIMFGARLIQNGKLDRVIAGGTECLSKFHISGFHSLQILDTQSCKPFDENRQGLTLGEGAAYLILESEEVVKAENKEVLCELTGFGNACEAFHQTASSPEGTGAVLAMQKALASANLNPSDIDYINAHGTGTENNDLSEGVAIETVFGSHIPPVSSTKAFTGHTTSAAGAVEAVLSVLAIKNHLIYPNLNFQTAMKELHFLPVKNLITDAKINHVLSNSFGFGGNDTSLIFSRY